MNIIVKSSYSRLPDGTLKSNMGDLLRSTVLTQCILGDFVWFTDNRSLGILKKFVDHEKLISYEEKFELSSNLKIFCADNYICNEELLSSLSGKWHGYFIDRGKVSAKNELIRATEPYASNNYECSWQQSLVEGMGFTWSGQDYPRSTVKLRNRFDVGLNWDVHSAWPSKRWPIKHWNRLIEILSKKYRVSWQEGLDNIEDYFTWVGACRVIITGETLGLHLASALRKNVIAITGPTTNAEYSYGRVRYVEPSSRHCMPCNAPICTQNIHCLSEIKAEAVADLVSHTLDNLTKN